MKRQEKGRGKLDIRVLFTLAAIAEILGTLLIATLLTALLENLLHEAIEVHPLVWLLLFGTTIGLTAATVVNVLLLRPVVRLSRAMKQVASGNFSVRLTTNSVINEIADSYDSFNRMVEALGETETLQTDFVSNVSHEIKTPVSAIEGYTTLLQSTDVSPEQAGYIERILLNTRRLSTLVGNILLLSKVSNHTMPMKQTCYRLDEQIRQAIVLLEAQWSPKQLDFDADLAEVTWRGPETLMLHVWTNLLSNAVKFSPQHGLIAVTLKQTDGRFETLMLGLRMTCGVCETDFQERHGVSLDALYGEKLRKFEHEGLLQHKTDRWSLTRRGMDVQNAVLVELMDD
jgi:two-component system sensor histidine kinase BaeS